MNKPFSHGITATLPDGFKTKQDLNLIYPTYGGFRGLPLDILPQSPAAVVFTGFASIFEKQKNISEGTLSDVLFGFAAGDWDLAAVGQGLTELRFRKYIFYTDAKRVVMPEEYFISHPESSPWVRYSPKFLACFQV